LLFNIPYPNSKLLCGNSMNPSRAMYFEKMCDKCDRSIVKVHPSCIPSSKIVAELTLYVVFCGHIAYSDFASLSPPEV
jgi:hypothetical protein